MTEPTQFKGIADAADAARDLVIRSLDQVPLHVRCRLFALTRTGSSPVDLVCSFVDAVYANRDRFSGQAIAVAAGAADIIDRHNFHSRLNGRAPGIRDALSRAAGFEGAWPAEDQDPPPDEAFVQQPAPEPSDEE